MKTQANKNYQSNPSITTFFTQDISSSKDDAINIITPFTSQSKKTRKNSSEIPVRIGFLGGLNEIGANMRFIEYNDNIIIIDAGTVFPGNNIYGVDYIIPDISYLVQNKEKIKGILITHGHLDHIGALKHVLPALHYPTIYSANLTIHMIKKSLEEVKSVHKCRYKIINPDKDILQLGVFSIESFFVNHNIPESLGFSIKTPKGIIVTPGDYKIDLTPSVDKPADLEKIGRIGLSGVKLMLGESTNAMRPGHIKSEKIIGETIDELIKQSKNRIIIATFATNVGRLIQIIQTAVKYGRTVFLAGRSMIAIVEIIKKLGYIKVPYGYIRKISKEVNSLSPANTLVLCTGSQGEEFSALARISRGEYPYLKVKTDDEIVMSTSPISGNEKAFRGMINDFIKQNIRVIENTEMSLHASGHAYQEDIKTMTSLLKPEYHVPIHGELLQRHAHKKLLIELGLKAENILLGENGAILEMYDDAICWSNETLNLETIVIDGFGLGHLSDKDVMSSRRKMASSGVITINFTITTLGNIMHNIEIESEGFVYNSEKKNIHKSIIQHVEYIINIHNNKKITVKEITQILEQRLCTFIQKEIGREPLIVIIPTIIK